RTARGRAGPAAPPAPARRRLGSRRGRPCRCSRTQGPRSCEGPYGTAPGRRRDPVPPQITGSVLPMTTGTGSSAERSGCEWRGGAGRRPAGRFAAMVDEVRLEEHIHDVPDWPEPGVVFKDLTPLLADGAAFAGAVDRLADHFVGRGITKVLGIEARGFVVAAPVAYRLGAGFVPARKVGKLPRETQTEEYVLEYGTDRLE